VIRTVAVPAAAVPLAPLQHAHDRMDPTGRFADVRAGRLSRRRFRRRRDDAVHDDDQKRTTVT